MVGIAQPLLLLLEQLLANMSTKFILHSLEQDALVQAIAQDGMIQVLQLLAQLGHQTVTVHLTQAELMLLTLKVLLQMLQRQFLFLLTIFMLQSVKAIVNQFQNQLVGMLIILNVLEQLQMVAIHLLILHKQLLQITLLHLVVIIQRVLIMPMLQLTMCTVHQFLVQQLVAIQTQMQVLLHSQLKLLLLQTGHSVALQVETKLLILQLGQQNQRQ